MANQKVAWWTWVPHQLHTTARAVREALYTQVASRSNVKEKRYPREILTEKREDCGILNTCLGNTVPRKDNAFYFVIVWLRVKMERELHKRWSRISRLAALLGDIVPLYW